MTYKEKVDLLISAKNEFILDLRHDKRYLEAENADLKKKLYDAVNNIRVLEGKNKIPYHLKIHFKTSTSNN